MPAEHATGTAGLLASDELNRDLAGLQGTYGWAVQSGAVTFSAGYTFNVAAVAAGDYVVNSVSGAAYAGGTVVLDAADATNPRVDRVVITAAGAVSVVKGTPRGPSTVYAAPTSGGSPTTAVATTGPIPAAVSSAQLETARIYVPANNTPAMSAASITDRRVSLGGSMPYQPPQILNSEILVGAGGAVINTSGVWTTANVAVYVPFRVNRAITARKIALNNGAAISGNVDVGIYDSDADGLPRTKLVASGSTAHSGTSAWQIFDVADTLLAPGLYYMACAFDNTTSAVTRLIAATAQDSRAFSIYEQATAFALPATATPVTFSATRAVPLMSVNRATA